MAGGLFVRQKGIDFMNHLNQEVIEDVVESVIYLYRVSPMDTQSNIYGESDEKRYFPAVQLYGLVRTGARQSNITQFGSDSTQTLDVLFNREMLKVKNISPQHGDILEWNSIYYEVDNADESKFVGGQTDWNFSILCNCHLTRKSVTLIDNTVVGSK